MLAGANLKELSEEQRGKMVRILLDLTLLMEQNGMTVEQVMALWPKTSEGELT